MSVTTWHEFGRRHGSYDVQPHQSPKELSHVLDLYVRSQPMTVVEIGICDGGTLHYWLRYAQPDARIVAVDVTDKRLDRTFYDGWTAGRDAHIVLGDSAKGQTFRAVAKLTPSVDWLYIDGDHTVEGALHDFEMYRKLMADGGHIVMHNILQAPHCPGTWKVWEAIKAAGYEMWEIVDPNARQPYPFGTGVILYKTEDNARPGLEVGSAKE